MIRLRVSRTVVRAETTSGVVPWTAEAPFATPAELADVIARLAAEAPRNGRHPTLVATLEPPLVQLRFLADLPPVRRGDLPTLVAGQTRRFFRANGHALVTDAVWIRANNECRVARAAAAEEAWLDAISIGARAAGMRLETIEVAGSPDLVLLPSNERLARRSSRRLQLWRLSVATAVIWLLAVVTFTTRLSIERRRVSQELAALQAPIAAMSDARRELREAAATVATMRNASAQRGEGLAALARITGAVPDSTVITAFTWSSDGSGALSGVALRAGDVVADLERAQAVVHARFEGDIVREQWAGRERQRFSILFGPNSQPAAHAQ